MLQGEHSVILSTFIKLPLVIKIIVLYIFEWLFYTGFTVYWIIWASSRENLSSGDGKQHRRRPACTSAPSDQRFCYSLFRKDHLLTCYRRNFNFIASLCLLRRLVSDSLCQKPGRQILLPRGPYIMNRSSCITRRYPA